MKKGEHTPGPWIHYADEDGDALIARDETGPPFACVWVRPGMATYEDACLIAAAPDLLALLEKLIDIEGPQPGTGEWANEVQAAIKKARGDK